MAKAYISTSQQKLLHVKSGNKCAICKITLAEIEAVISQGENAHIYGENPGAARYDASQDEGFVNSEENLIYVCPNCHNNIDNVTPHNYPPERLFELKREHEDFVRALPQSLPDNEKISTYLSEVIISLSSIDDKPLSDIYDRSYLAYEIQDKIDYNNIKHYNDTINEYKVFQYYLHGEKGLYDIALKEGGFDKLKIYNRILHVYMETLEGFQKKCTQLPYSGDSIYFDGFTKIFEIIKNSKGFPEINDDDLMHCLHIILVDAFIECKWFENPMIGGT